GPRLEVISAEPGEAAAVEAPDGVADGGQHPLHLMLAPLAECELDARGAETAGPRRRRLPVVELDAPGAPAKRLLARRPLHLPDVDLLDAVARVCQAVRE